MDSIVKVELRGAKKRKSGYPHPALSRLGRGYEGYYDTPQLGRGDLLIVYSSNAMFSFFATGSFISVTYLGIPLSNGGKSSPWISGTK